MTVDNLNPLPSDHLRCPEDETQLERTFGRRGVKRHAQAANDAGKLAPVRPGHGDVMAEPKQTQREARALVVGAAAGQQRIQMKESKSCGGVTHGPSSARPARAVASRTLPD